MTGRFRLTRGWVALHRVQGILGGEPVYVGTRISVECVCCRWWAGEPIKALAHDYHLTPSQIEKGLAEWCGKHGRWRELVPVKGQAA